ncbi:MAG TPA: HEAT repeat domain-containing protein [Humisphaera sp.]|nr:HEAT repeat domain-containing protein [Humisphaera sp.]
MSFICCAIIGGGCASHPASSNSDVASEIKSAHDADPNVRWLAVDHMSRMKGADDSVVVQALIEALSDSNQRVRLRAAEALAGFGDPAALPELDRVAKKDDAPEVLQAAQASIAAINARVEENKKAQAAKTSEVDENIEKERRLQLIESNAAKPDPANFPLLVTTLNDPDPRFRAAAARGLAAIGDARAVPPLTKLLDDKDPVVQKSGRDALQTFPDGKTAVASWDALHDAEARRIQKVHQEEAMQDAKLRADLAEAAKQQAAAEQKRHAAQKAEFERQLDAWAEDPTHAAIPAAIVKKTRTMWLAQLDKSIDDDFAKELNLPKGADRDAYDKAIRIMTDQRNALPAMGDDAVAQKIHAAIKWRGDQQGQPQRLTEAERNDTKWLVDLLIKAAIATAPNK